MKGFLIGIYNLPCSHLQIFNVIIFGMTSYHNDGTLDFGIFSELCTN